MNNALEFTNNGFHFTNAIFALAPNHCRLPCFEYNANIF